VLAVPFEYTAAPADLSAQYIKLRGLTRENPFTPDELRSFGITAESWAQDITAGRTFGFIAQSGAQMVGYCFGDSKTGEVLVLAVLPAYEGQGVGQRLLSLLVSSLRAKGHKRLFLGCSPDPAVRSHGFYRYLGWQSTESFDARGDEVLELLSS
jgi:ribosomal protein S18 acetylase RimI-like enzyme